MSVDQMPDEYRGTYFDFGPDVGEFPPSFAIVAGGHPRVGRVSERVNAYRETALRALLVELGLTHRCLVGWGAKAEGGRHEEESWLVVCSRDEAVDLGCAFDQDGVWWVDGDALSVLPCLGKYPDTPVTPGFRARVRRREG